MTDPRRALVVPGRRGSDCPKEPHTMGEPLEKYEFIVTFPVFGLTKPGGSDQWAMSLPNGEKAGVFFTEELFGERYRDLIPGLKDLVVTRIGDASFFPQVLANMQKYGINYVIFDPTIAGADAFHISCLRPAT
jgi:hypothetical protein